MAGASSKRAIGACTIALIFSAISPRVARAESLDHDPDAKIDRESGVRDARGRMDKLDVDVVNLLGSFDGRRPGMMGISFGYRIVPELTTGVYFDAMLLGVTAQPDDPCQATNDCFRRHVRFGTFTEMHFLPTSAIDPWISVGVGGTTFERIGLDTSASAGFDVRIGDVIAVGPLFTRTQTISGPQPSWNALGVHALLTF